MVVTRISAKIDNKNKKILCIGDNLNTDIKGANLIKGIHLEGLRVLGNPNEFALKYYRDGIDEIIYMDSVASLYGRNHLADVIRAATESIFVPLTVGGGIRNIDDASEILRGGADKVAINTQVVHEPKLISEIAEKFGSQCVVVAIDAKKINGEWIVHLAGGTIATALNLFDWAKEVEKRGAGEILFTSMNNDGTKSGFATEALAKLSTLLNIPIIASGGAGNIQHFVDAFQKGKADAALAASVFHFGEIPILKLKQELKNNKIPIRI